MLTGDIDVSYGDAHLDGFSIRRNMKAVLIFVYIFSIIFNYSYNIYSRFNDVLDIVPNLMQRSKK